MNTDIDIVTITRVLADGSHVSLGDSRSTIEQLVAALDAMTEGREVLDDIFTHHTIKLPENYGGEEPLPKPEVDNRPKQDIANKPRLVASNKLDAGKKPTPISSQKKSLITNQFLVF